MKKTFSLVFSFIILFPSLLSLEHYISHDHQSCHNEGNNIYAPEYDCLTCDFISNSITDYSFDNSCKSYKIVNEIKINSEYNFSLSAHYAIFNKNKAPPYFI